MKKVWIAVWVGALLTAAQVGASTVTLDRVSGYYYSSGGEFNISPVGGGAYAPEVIVNNRYGNPGYESFCMQVDESVAIPGTYSATASQVDDTGNALRIGTAYLYAQFASGTLSGYDYADTAGGTGSGRAASAWALQNAIWWLQGESNGNHTTADEAAIGAYYLSLVSGMFGDPQAAAHGAYGVDILNLYNGGIQYQSQLTLHVPDAGATAMLLGLALGAIGLVSRKLRVR